MLNAELLEFLGFLMNTVSMIYVSIYVISIGLCVSKQKVMEYEKSQGRTPIHQKKKGLGYDILSDDRKIEVKGTTWKWEKNKSSFQYVSDNERRRATHIYLVCDVRKKKELFIFKMSRIHNALIPEISFMLYFSKCRDKESDESKCARAIIQLTYYLLVNLC
jgi:hypothetical protein